mgnify:CR=1 FL=1|jgi:hypothetical protein
MGYRVISFEEYETGGADNIFECCFEHNGNAYEACMQNNNTYGYMCDIRNLESGAVVYSKCGIRPSEDRILECIEEFVYDARQSV